MRDLGQKQADLIATGDMGSLLRMIAAKNQLIAALQSIELALAPYHEQDPDQRQWATAESRASCARQAESCQQLLGEVMELERQNEQNMIERRDHVAGQLQAAQAAGATRGAYQAHQLSKPQGPHHIPNSIVVPLPSASFSNPGQGQQLDLQSDA